MDMPIMPPPSSSSSSFFFGLAAGRLRRSGHRLGWRWEKSIAHGVGELGLEVGAGAFRIIEEGPLAVAYSHSILIPRVYAFWNQLIPFDRFALGVSTRSLGLRWFHRKSERDLFDGAGIQRKFSVMPEIRSWCRRSSLIA